MLPLAFDHGPVAIFLGAVGTGLTVGAIGHLIVVAIDDKIPNISGPLRFVTAYLLGTAALQLLVFTSCVLQIAGRVSFAIIATIACGLCMVSRRSRQQIVEWRAPLWPYSNASLLAALACSPYMLLYLCHAMAPEVSSDAAGYHLGLVEHYYRTGGFTGLTSSIYGFLSQGAEMLYIFAATFGGYSSAKLLHSSFVGVTIAAMVAVMRQGGVSSFSQALAICLFVASPLVTMTGTIAYNDVMLAAINTSVVALVYCHSKANSIALSCVLGVLAGFAFAVKYTGCIALIFILGAISAEVWGRRSLTWNVVRSVLCVMAGWLLLAGPWLLKNYVVTGNPVAPFFNSVFPNPYVSADWEQNYRVNMAHFNGFGQGNVTDYIFAPIELATDSSRLNGIAGPMFLLTPLMLFGVRQRMGRWMVVAAAVALMPWLSNVGARFIIPALPFVSIGIAGALDELVRSTRRVVAASLILLHLLLSWPSVVDLWHEGPAWKVVGDDIPWRMALRFDDEREYVRRWTHNYDAATLLNSVAAAEDRVLTFEQYPDAYTVPEVLVSFQSHEGIQLYEALAAPNTDDERPIRKELAQLGNSEPLTGFRVRQTANSLLKQWTINEIQFLDQHGALQPVPRSRMIAAYPTTLDSNHVLDGSIFSYWRSGTPLRDDMFLSLTLDEPIQVSAVAVIYPWGQYFQELAFEYQTTSSADAWQISTDVSVTVEAYSRMDHIAWAHKRLCTSSIDYLIVDPGMPGLSSTLAHVVDEPELWGLDLVGAVGTRRLFALRCNENEMSLGRDRD